jgi:hypothetical protein
MPEPTIPMSEEAAKDEAARLIAEAYTPTSYRNDSLPATTTIGTAPPVPQPGRPPMSQGATDASVLMLAGGAATSMVGLTAAVVMYVSQYADPVVCGIVFGAPTAVVLALARLAKRAKGVLPEEHHHHYDGPVYQDQREQRTENRGVWVKTTNQQ